MSLCPVNLKKCQKLMFSAIVNCVDHNHSRFLEIIKLKRKLFPCTEFIIGRNEKIEEKYRKIRNFLICTVASGTILGIMINLLTELLF